MDKFVPAFKQSFLDTSLLDSTTDIAEIGIDSVLDDGLLKDLPFFNLILGTFRTVKSIRERNLLKNTVLFINSLNAKEISPQKLSQYKEKLNNEKTAEQELGRILVILDQYVDSIKSRMLAVLFRKYIEGEYSWDKFCELSDILNRLFIEDISYLDLIATAPEATAAYHIYEIPYNVKRLESLGVVEIYGEYARFGNRLLQGENVHVQLTENGRIFDRLQDCL